MNALRDLERSSWTIVFVLFRASFSSKFDEGDETRTRPSFQEIECFFNARSSVILDASSWMHWVKRESMVYGTIKVLEKQAVRKHIMLEFIIYDKTLFLKNLSEIRVVLIISILGHAGNQSWTDIL